MSASSDHMQVGGVECRHPSCHRTFKSQEFMQQHYTDRHSQAAHQLHNLPCHHCNKSFTTNTGLQDHLRSAHQVNNAFTADPCVQIPLQQQDLQVGDVACNDCGKLFRSTDYLHQHQWNSADHTRVSSSPNPIHGCRVRACSQCGAKFASADELEQHFVDQHPVSEVPKSGEDGTWQHVAERFRAAWKKPTTKLYNVHRIYKVYNPGWRRKDFEQYRKELKKEMANQKLVKEDNLDLRNRVLGNGNELRRYHGTTVECRLGRPTDEASDADMTLSLCTNSDCSLCRILQTGFRKSKCKVERFQRFGKGIYCSSMSSKASAYVKCTQSAESAGIMKCMKWILSWFNSYTGTCKVMIACKVLAGRPYHSTANLQKLQEPPPGFHSVQGDPGVALNYEELVVYDDSAILPDFIVLYSSSD